jgi:hypothetical protein
MHDDRPRFETAMVATLYLLGARGEALAVRDLGPEASALLRTLSSADQKTRALGLAKEVARIGLALDRGGIE